jgi:hypothetical protein
MHPFALDLCELESLELDFEEHLTKDEAANIGGGTLPGGRIITKALYEGGGWYPPIDRHPPYPIFPNKPPGYPPIKEPPIYTTLALGEEGGGY